MTLSVANLRALESVAFPNPLFRPLGPSFVFSTSLLDTATTLSDPTNDRRRFGNTLEMPPVR